MFSEILKIIPKLDSAALSDMERSLSSRFQRVAKSFGGGLMNVIKGGAIGIGLFLISKLLNPLNEVQDTIDKMLHSSNDVVTNAKQFGSTPGELFKLQKIAEAKGVDPEALNMMLVKFQGAISEAAADPLKKTSVRAFAGEKNIVKALFEFIQSSNALPMTQQVQVQQEVFGERYTLKNAELLRTDFTKLIKEMGLKGAETYTPGLQKMADLNDLADAKKASNDAQDMINKSKLINRGIIESRDLADKQAKLREDAQIEGYKNLQTVTAATDRIMTLIDQGVAQVGKFIEFATPAIRIGVDAIERLANSRWFRGSTSPKKSGGGGGF